MPFLSEVFNALYGAYRLARLDPSGMTYFNLSEEGFWNSFKAAAIILPLFTLLMLVRYAVDELDTPLWRFLSVEFIAYVTGWVAFPVLMIGICRQFERLHRYAGFIIAYNWASVLQNALYIPIAILSVSGQLTGGAGVIVLAAMVAIIFYNWFIAKTALEIPGPAAAAVVLVDFVASFAINMYAEGLI